MRGYHFKREAVEEEKKVQFCKLITLSKKKYKKNRQT